ncbi:MAG TPA: S8 family serine peptidase [Actinomycetota bacterium]|nr:S8 family serine peptidase [Actinomycetota bacterium]
MSRRSAVVAAIAVLAAALSLVPASAVSVDPASLPYDPAHVLVRFDAGTGSAERAEAHRLIGSHVVNRFASLGIDVVALPDGLAAPDAVARYARDARVEHASLNKKLFKLSTPGDTLFGQQWGFHNTAQSVSGSLVRGVADADIDAPEGWTAAYGAGSFPTSGGTLVAVLDTGIDLGHTDLMGKVRHCAGATSAVGVVVEGACQDDNLHGTHTAGTVAANTNNTVGVAGTAPNAELAIFKFLNAAGVGFLADEIAGLQWATARGAKVFSMSYGSYDPDSNEEKALQNAYNAGVLPIAAAGNDYDSTKNYPAFYNVVMSVASHNQADAISDFSNCNGDVEIAAPGEDVWSTLPGNSYGPLSGTSMATPHVAGVAALLMWKKGTSNVQTRNLMVNSAEAVASTGGRSACNGIKRVNLASALGSGDTTPPAPGGIAGTVTDQQAKTPLGGATVDCGTGGTATTASNGTYSLSNVPAGSYSCTASKSGYRSKTQSVGVSSGQTAVADFALRASR